MTMSYSTANRVFFRMLSLIACMLMLAVLPGCISGQRLPMADEDRALLKTAPQIHVVRYVSVPLSILTPANVAGAGLLASSTGSAELPAGHELQRAYSLTPAADELTTQLVQKLKADGTLTNLRVEPAPRPLPWTEDVSEYRKKYPSGLVLEIVASYSAGYQPMHWKTYNFGMYGNARLIRMADGKILWKDVCGVGGLSGEKLTLDVSEFEANKGARLKSLIQRGGDGCSRTLADKLLGKDRT